MYGGRVFVLEIEIVREEDKVCECGMRVCVLKRERDGETQRCDQPNSTWKCLISSLLDTNYSTISITYFHNEMRHVLTIIVLEHFFHA